MFETPEIWSVARAAVAETAAVAHAEGVASTSTTSTRRSELLGSMPAEKTTSTLQDLEAGRPFETDAITGVVVRLATEHGIDVPTVRALDAMLRVISP